MKKRGRQPLPEPAVLDFFMQMVLGLKHVHDRKILHRSVLALVTRSRVHICTCVALMCGYVS